MKIKKCDCCKREIPVEKAEVRVDVFMNTNLPPLQGRAYSSHNFDLCEACFDEMVRDIKKVVESYGG